jgi:ribulose-bisphosphate carboxylase large chain
MLSRDLEGFYCRTPLADPERFLLLHYDFETVVDPEEAAAHLCQEQSTAQWKRPGKEEDYRVKHGAKVVAQVHGQVPTAAFSVLKEKHPVSTACSVTVAHPHVNFGARIPNMLTAICGEGVFFSPGIAAIKLMDITFPENYLRCFEGPRFGIEGFRDLIDVHDRPILFGIPKPNLGLSPEDFSALAAEAWRGGLDVAKDDEMLADSPWSLLTERLRLLKKARIDCQRATGEKKLYLVNITDEVDRILELLDVVEREGEGNAVMLNTMTMGLSAIRMLRKNARMPIAGHFAGTAPSVGVTNFGIHSKVIVKLQRILGCDIVIFPGFGGRMKTADAEVMENIAECVKPLGHIPPALPVPAGSNWAGSLGELYAKLKSADFGIVPGRAVFDHPLGARGGARGLRQGWEAAASGVALAKYAEDHRELALSIEAEKTVG